MDSNLIRLMKRDRDELLSLISDKDVFFGSDGHAYMPEKTLKWYYDYKYELDAFIGEVESGD